jgi:hypothetical protein
MKRRHVQLAFVGEGNAPGDHSLEQLMSGDEAVEVQVTQGKILAVVPTGTGEEDLFDHATFLGGELVLSNGMHLSFEIQDGATGAQFNAAADEPRQTHSGLSTIPDVPGGV